MEEITCLKSWKCRPRCPYLSRKFRNCSIKTRHLNKIQSQDSRSTYLHPRNSLNIQTRSCQVWVCVREAVQPKMWCRVWTRTMFLLTLKKVWCLSSSPLRFQTNLVQMWPPNWRNSTLSKLSTRQVSIREWRDCVLCVDSKLHTLLYKNKGLNL